MVRVGVLVKSFQFGYSRAGAQIVRFLITGVMNWSARCCSKTEIYALGPIAFDRPSEISRFL